jgi:hypothetical protein
MKLSVRPFYLVALLIALFGIAMPASAGAYIYWGSGGSSDLIGRANNDGEGVEQSFITDGEGHAPIALDSSHIYYTGQKGGLRANLDGTEQIATGLSAFQEVAAVDNGHIYWVVGTSGIGRANLDGSDPEPEFITEIGAAVESGGIAAYNGYLYWANYSGGFGATIGRANLATKVVESEFTEEFPEAGGPRGIAVDADGVFWTDNPSGGTNKIGHVGLLGGKANLDYIPGAHVGVAGIAVQGSDLYWESYNASEATIAHAELVLAETGDSHAAVVNENFIELGNSDNEWLAVNSATSPPPPPPPPPPPGGNPAPTPGPIGPKPLKCKKGFKKQTVKGKAKCLKVKHHKRHHAHH